MSQIRTLAQLRALATPEDRQTEALALPPVQPYRHYALDRPVKIKPQTLAQLRTSYDWRGPLAAAGAEWGAVLKWLCATRHREFASARVALVAASYARRMKRWGSGLLVDRSVLKEIGTIAATCREAWRRAGQPHLRESIREMRHYVAICERIDRERAPVWSPSEVVH